MDERLALLPSNVRELVLQLPASARAAMLDKLLAVAEISYRALEQRDVEVILERTKASYQYGFLPQDMQFTWEDVAQPNKIALAAFDEKAAQGTDGAEPTQGAAADIPVAFVIAEIARLDYTLAYIRKDMAQAHDRPPTSIATTAQDTPQDSTTDPATQAEAPQPVNTATQAQQATIAAPGPSSTGQTGDHEQRLQSVAELVDQSDWETDADVAVAVQYLGVDFEYRRQGLGHHLMDTVRDVAKEAGAKMLWLTVAEYNTAAVRFYKSYGFKPTSDRRQGEKGAHQLMVYVLPESRKRAPRLKKAARSGRKGASRSGKGFGARAQLATSHTQFTAHTLSAPSHHRHHRHSPSVPTLCCSPAYSATPMRPCSHSARHRSGSSVRVVCGSSCTHTSTAGVYRHGPQGGKGPASLDKPHKQWPQRSVQPGCSLIRIAARGSTKAGVVRASAGSVMRLR